MPKNSFYRSFVSFSFHLDACDVVSSDAVYQRAHAKRSRTASGNNVVDDERLLSQSLSLTHTLTLSSPLAVSLPLLLLSKLMKPTNLKCYRLRLTYCSIFDDVNSARILLLSMVVVVVVLLLSVNIDRFTLHVHSCA